MVNVGDWIANFFVGVTYLDTGVMNLEVEVDVRVVNFDIGVVNFVLLFLLDKVFFVEEFTLLVLNESPTLVSDLYTSGKDSVVGNSFDVNNFELSVVYSAGVLYL